MHIEYSTYQFSEESKGGGFKDLSVEGYVYGINQSINQIYLPGKYYKNYKKKGYTKSTIRHFPGGKYKSDSTGEIYHGTVAHV